MLCARSIAAAVLSLCVASVTVLASDPVLDNYGTSLASVLATDKTQIQLNRPIFEQRGVDIDGTLRAPAVLGWTVNADPFSGGYGSGRRIGDIDLANGTYAPTEVDLAFPSLGVPVVIGRTYNARQLYNGSRYDSDAYQGINWSQTAQPELVFKAGASDDLDTVYIVYGADRYIEFKRVATGQSEFKSKNGAAGVVQYTAGSVSVPETYTYYDQRGNTMTFFGFNSAAAPCKGSLWKMTDTSVSPSTQAITYYGHASTGATAISSGYDGSGRPSVLYDGSNRRYTFTYSTVASVTRLTQVKAEIQSGGTWTSPTTVGQVDYDYYSTTDSGKGLAGDLKQVTITLKGTSTDFVKKKYYRYYTSSYTNSDGSRGNPHQVKLAVGFEGVRQREIVGSLASASDDDLKPYSEAWMEYASSSDYRLAKGFFNGECGCSGGTNGTYEFTYGTSSSYSTYTANTSYDAGWATRTVVKQPDSNYTTVYFDEAGQVIGRVLTNADPSASPTKTWAHEVTRNSSGQVTDIYSPATNSAYTHSTGSFSHANSGLVTVYGRKSSGDEAGLRENVQVKDGSGGSATTVSSVTMTCQKLTVGASGVNVPYIQTSLLYPASGTSYTTTITTTWWSGTASNVGYIVPKTITSAAPAVATGHNGSNSATSTVRYLRSDGTTAFIQDATSVLSYNGRDAWGRTITQIADAKTSTSGDYTTEDAPATWSGLPSNATAIHAKTTMTYDDQGRIQDVTMPSVNGTRVAATRYTVLTDGKLGTFSFPRYLSSNYYGPASYSEANHAGRTTRQATIAMSSPSGSVPSTSMGSTWANVVDTVYDSAGAKAL